MAADVHTWFAWVAIWICAGSGLVALVYHVRKRALDLVFRGVVTLSVVAMLIQISLGFIAFGQDLEPGSIHMFYGFVILLTFTFIYIYRIQFEKRPALYWGLTLLFIAGLGIRGVLNFGQSF